MTPKAPVEILRDCGSVSLKCGRGIFIAASSKSSGMHAAVYLEENQRDQFQAVLKSLSSQFGPQDSLEIKLVGSRLMINECDPLLARTKAKLVRSIFREMPHEIVYDSVGGKIRVSKERTRVLIADDSTTIRKLLERILGSDPEVEVVASAGLPSQVDELIVKHRPHVITLDLHMPEMDGVTLLKRILPKYLIPTVVISSISMAEGPMVLEALEHGAIDYVQKPSADQLDLLAPMILEKIKAAALVKTKNPKAQESARKQVGGFSDRSQLIAIGSSTGGTEALREVLTRLPADIPPIVITQHIPAGFSKAFADRMNQLCPFEVKEAEDGDEVRPGRVLIGAGATQFSIAPKDGKMVAVVTDDPPVNRHKPSVDVLFRSVATYCAKSAICVILTGMGADGAKGMLEAKKAGARTIAQDEESCVVFGMPREAIRLGAADRICSLSSIPEELGKLVSKHKKAA